MRVTVKQQTRTGKPAAQASEKQIKFAAEILARINNALDEISDLGFSPYADEAAINFDKLTDMVYAGPRDVIEYLKNTGRRAVYIECYGMARRDRNVTAVNALNPNKLTEV
jgi:hypothetical protein